MIQATTTAKLKKSEKEQLVSELVALTTEQRLDFMAANSLPISLSNKGEVRERISDGLKAGDFGHEAIIGYLDSVVPWGKQHVFLFKGPKLELKKTWQKKSWVMNHLKQNAEKIHDLVGNPRFVGLPDELTPVSVEFTRERFAINMVRRRDWVDRDSTFDKKSKTPAGEAVELRAFVHRSIRNFVAFEWDLKRNAAVLRISQLAGKVKYETVKDEFTDLVADWLNLGTFEVLDIQSAIRKLLTQEKNGAGITQSHHYQVETMAGRTVSSSSNSSDLSVFGEKTTDKVFESIPASAIGNVGNFFWLPLPGNPLSEKFRVELVGSKKRVNFTAPSSKPIVERVLSDIRKHCK